MKTLLLNSSFEIISFINFRKCIKLYIKGKVEIVSTWDCEYTWEKGRIQHPAVVRMKYYIRRPQMISKFTRKNVFRRDLYTCQYCSDSLTVSSATLDHIVPRSRGGKTIWDNVLTSCLNCNNKKKDRTPEEAGMIPISKPFIPKLTLNSEYKLLEPKHEDWSVYFNFG